MSAERPTLADLRKAGTITSFEIVAAVDAYVHNSSSGPFRFASGHSIDIAAAIATSSEATEMMARSGPKEKTFRNAVTAIVMTVRPTSI
ncbi:MAG: hypothetical protein ABW003_02800 [Microvirga sp.]